MTKRVCVIGAGPSGMGTLAMFNKLQNEGDRVNVTCYEKQDTPGGLWNQTWRTGLDEFGEAVHCSMYKDLFSNGPKEALELPDYTFFDHFSKAIPSFPPREVLIDYLRGYWKFHGVKDVDVKTNNIVRHVTYNEESKTFTVKAVNLKEQQDITKEFDFVIVATGHFSTPNVPSFKGIETFNGRVLHSHDFRNAREFTGQDILVIGSSYSAEDIALQCHKFDAKSVSVSYRSAPMNFHWPKQITEVPLLCKVDGSTCHFKDGTKKNVDAIILCTGYKHHFPFMPKELRLECGNIYFPPNLYRSLQWFGVTEGKKNTDGRLFYIGMQDQFYTFSMFMVQSLWIAHVIKGLLKTPSFEECLEEIKKWRATMDVMIDCYMEIDSQTAYVKRLAYDIGYKVDLDAAKLFYEWEHDKHDDDILTYRDKSYKSLFSGHDAPFHPVKWINNFDASLITNIGGIGQADDCKSSSSEYKISLSEIECVEQVALPAAHLGRTRPRPFSDL